MQLEEEKPLSARVYLKKGKGNISVNDKKLDEYFGRKVAQMLVMQPLELLGLTEKIDVNVKVRVVVALDKLAR